MPNCFFTLNLTSEQCLEYYNGRATSVVTRTESGKQVAFPVSKLVPFITRQGVKGRFCLTYTSNHQFVSLKSLDAGT